MKVAAIICEYNPFHNGHEYLIKTIKNNEADFCVCIMSGNFVQRGVPAIFDKFSRALMALQCGADLVIEMPLIFSSAQAREFACAGVSLALKTGIIDSLFFGTMGDLSLESLKDFAFRKDEAEKNADFKNLISKGKSYPAALSAICGHPSISPFFLPDNILATEYLRALKNLDEDQSIMARPVPKVRAFRASDLRKILDPNAKNNLSPILAQVPKCTWPIYEFLLNNLCYLPHEMNIDSLGVCHNFRTFKSDLSFTHTDALGSYLKLKLLESKYGSGQPLSDYQDVSFDIARRLYKVTDQNLSFHETIMKVKSRQYTYGRIARALLHIVLGITKEEFELKKKNGYTSSIRILGFRKEAASRGLLKMLKKKANLQLITNPSKNEAFLLDDLFRNQLYYSLIPALKKNSEFQHSPVIV